MGYDKLTGERLPLFKRDLGNGRFGSLKGYIRVKLKPSDFYYPMASRDGFVMEHRLVVAKGLRRCLHSWEIVHHINKDKGDNRRENLQLELAYSHLTITILQNRILSLERRIKELEGRP